MLTLGALLDDNHIGPIANQQVDRMLVRGNATGTTPVNVLTIGEARAASSVAAQNGDLPAGAYGPGSSNGNASISQNLVGNATTYWDYRLSHAYVTAIPLPPGIIIPGSGGGSGGGGSGSGGGDLDIRWQVVPQVPSYISIPGALFSAGVQDMDNLHRRLGEIREFGNKQPDANREVFARFYGSSMDYSTNIRFRDFG